MDIVVDVKNQPLGRMASRIAVLLQGKNSPGYEQRLAGSDRIIVKNIRELRVSGRKMEQKVYYRHTGYMGHLKEKSLKQAMEKSPAWVLHHAVRGMLPKNSLRDKRMKRLVIE